MTIRKKIIGRLGKTLTGALAIALFGTAAQADDRAGAWDYWWLSDPIEGLWDVTVNITPCPTGPTLVTFKAMALYARGGTFHDLNETGKVGPFPRSAGFGTWDRGKWRQYGFDVKFFVFDMAGAPAGWSIIRHDVELARDGLSYVSKGTAENFGTNGEPLADGVPGRPKVGCSNSTAVRFK